MDAGLAVRLTPNRDGDYFESLSLVEATGEVRWTAYPTVLRSNDAWVSAEFDGDVVIARTWSCFQVRLCLASGDVLQATFTK